MPILYLFIYTIIALKRIKLYNNIEFDRVASRERFTMTHKWPRRQTDQANTWPPYVTDYWAKVGDPQHHRGSSDASDDAPGPVSNAQLQQPGNTGARP